MNKQQIMEWFYTNSTNLTGTRILLVLFSALCIAMLIFLTYKLTYRGVAYNVRFNVTNVIILLICVVLMLMISSNIVISLGMVGALSIVRFRTAIKDARDTVFVFWSIVLGLCVGSQNFTLAGLSTFFIAAICFGFKLMPKIKNKYTLVIRGIQGELIVEDIENILVEKISAYNLEAVNQTDRYIEIVYTIKGKDENCVLISQSIKQLSGVKQANIINANV